MKFIQFIPYALAALFLYAGLIKIADPALFQLQMSKSPLLPASLIPLLSYAIPCTEIGLAVLLFTGIRLEFAFYASFALMALFTAYLLTLYIMFTGADLPCACGGILGKMSYPTHIIFNSFYTILAGIGALSLEKRTESA